MASGNTHEAFGKAIGIPTTIIAAYHGAPFIPLALGQAIALFIASPDVDTRSNATRRWGVLRGVWSPLQSMTKHRGLTHHPIFGPIVVMGYLGFIVVMSIVGVWIGLSAVMGEPLRVDASGLMGWSRFGLFAVWFMVGVFGQFWLHLCLDWVSSLLNGKRKKNKKRRKRR